jgi:23S rRNA pseudouridine1911/1915/1917 synthase
MFTVPEDSPRVRLDHWLADKYPALSRAFLQKLCSEDKVIVNGRPEKSGFKLKAGDQVEILFDFESMETIPDIELPILYEDKNVIVVDKPAGVISHARGKFWNEPSVASFIRQKTGQDGERAGIVHRLDRVTSGIMICAKNNDAMVFLQKQFSSRDVKKTYIAIVRGHLNPPEAIIDMPIGRNLSKPQTFHATAVGKPARTKYTVERSFSGYDLVRLEPETGRTHQIRVHLHEIGHPIIGDHLYVGEASDRLYLHAVSLEITLPDGVKKLFESPLPTAFATFEKKHHD